MSTTTARGVRRSLIRRGLDPKFPEGFPGHKRGAKRVITIMRHAVEVAAKAARALAKKRAGVS